MPIGENLIELPPLASTVRPGLSGGLAPLRSEVEEDGPYDVTGTIPPSIDGMLMLIGPNPVFIEDLDAHDLDRGEGMVHAIDFDRGQPTTVRSRFVRTRGLADRWGAKAAPGSLALAGPRANRSIVNVAGRLLALDGAGYGYRITPELATAFIEDFDSMLSTAMGSSVAVNSSDGSGTFLSWYMDGSPGLLLHELSADGVITSTTPLAVPLQPDDPPIAVLDDLVAIGLSSLFFDRSEVGDDRELAAGLRFDPDRASAVGLHGRKAEGSSLHLCHGRPGAITEFAAMTSTSSGADGVFLFQRPRREGDAEWRPTRRGGILTNFSADARTKSLRLEDVDDVDLAGISIDEVAAADVRRHAYAVTQDQRTVVKYNIRNGSATRVEMPEHLDAGTPTFWRDPDGRSDEEGWLFVPCFDRSTEASTLVVYDATRMNSGSEFTIGLPSRIPLGVVGSFIPGPTFR